MSKRWFFISVLTNVVQLFIIISMGYFLWFKPSPSYYDKDLIEQQKKELHMENTLLLRGIEDNRIKILNLQRVNDSLKTVPAKIKSEYAKKYKKIDALTARQLTHELDSAYANDNR